MGSAAGESRADRVRGLPDGAGQVSGATLSWRAAAAIFGIALLLRLLHVAQISQAPFFGFYMGDAVSYHFWAEELAGGNWLGDEVFYQAPLYPYLLGSLYAIGLEGPLVLRVVQAVLGSAACVLVADAAARLDRRRTGWIAGIMLAVYGPAIFFDSLIQKSVLDTLLLGAGLSWFARFQQQPRFWKAGVWGMAMGALILSRENALVLVAVSVAAVVLRYPLRESSRYVSAFIVGASLLLAPVVVRNAVVGDGLHLTTSQFGPNFYIGNHPGANGRYQPLRPHRGSARYERYDARELAEEALGRELTWGEVSDYWAARAFAYIRNEPADWLRLLGRKLALTWNAVEIVDTEDVYSYAEWSWTLAAGRYFHFGVLAPLAVFGLCVTRARWRNFAMLYGWIAAYALSVVAFYVFGRYRYPLVPILMLFAAFGMSGAVEWMSRTGKKEKLITAVLVLLSLFACNWKLVPIAPMRATMHYNVGVEFEAIGAYDEAVTQYDRALAWKPDYVDPMNNLGTVYLAVGNYEQAAEYFRRAVFLQPYFVPGWYNLGITLGQAGDLPGARDAFLELVRLQPESAEAYALLAQTLDALGDEDGARDAWRTARSLDPEIELPPAALDGTDGEREPGPGPVE